MSGHSKWSTIKRKKGALDAKRGKLYTKMSQAIAMAAQQGGGDSNTNFTLRLAIDKAKTANMPKDNIERAIKRGTGESDSGVRFEEIVYEGYGPEGVAVLVDTTTDNKNRTAAEVRHIFGSHGGAMGAEGSVAWQFEVKGSVTLKCKSRKKSEKFGKEDEEIPLDQEEMMLEVMDMDMVEDVHEVQVDEMDGTACSGLEVHCAMANLSGLREALEDAGYMIESAEIIKVPNTVTDVEDSVKAKVQKLVDELEDYDDVQSVWVNIEFE